MKKLWLVVVGAMLFIALPVYAETAGKEASPAKDKVVGKAKGAETSAKPDPLTVPCDPAMDTRTSDLCAQWKAADAARESTLIAKGALEEQIKANRAAWWVGLGSLFSIGVTTYFAYRSVRIADATARYAQETLMAERAWLTPANLELVYRQQLVRNGNLVTDYFQVKMEWKNTGRSPSKSLRTYSLMKTVPANSPVPHFEIGNITEASATTGPNEVALVDGQGIDGAEGAEIRQRDLDLYFYSKAWYEDVFSKHERTSEVCYKIPISFVGGQLQCAATQVGQQNNVT